MSNREKLISLRGDIDKVNTEMVKLFCERMNISEKIAEVKAAENITVTDETRERQIIEAAAASVGEKDKADVTAFIRTLIAFSKIRQNRSLMLVNPASFPAPVPMKDTAKVAFQGVSGAWGEVGAEQMFPGCPLEKYEYFEDVFTAVREGKADYGVLPIENSYTGVIGEVYDLLRRHDCFIVRETWVSVRQCLLALDGAGLNDIREVFSHPEGFNQSRRFLKNRSWDLTACRNTAYAAQLVAEKQDKRYAAIGSRRAAEVHGLTVLAPDIMDNPNNRTRFIAIAAAPAYDETSATTGITFSTAHKSGALCAVLECFMLAGINLTRIESRPAPNNSYRFFADLQANIMADNTIQALNQAAAHCDYFEILGCYPTVNEK